jgi:hypothetical protein
MNKLGKLTQVDLRAGWKHEAGELTPWMVESENIAQLCEELDIEVEDVRREESVGRFNVDILAKEVETGRVVIIENQLEVTDHKHLGQLLTYASGHDASIIIWVVADFRDEHKQAIEWFNRHMPKAISFFLIKLELWSVDGSAPAPKFNVVCRPNDWGKEMQAAGQGNKASETKLQQQEFWEALKAFAAEHSSEVVLSHKASPQHWYNITLGRSGVHLALTINSVKQRLGCELYISNNAQLYARLVADAPAIERELAGLNIEWRELPERAASRIIALHSGDPADQTKWPEYFTWLLNTAESFQKAFKGRIK